MASIDLTGKRFGRLVAIERSPRSTSKLPRWICRCDCGAIHDTRASSLTNQYAKSCGCLHRELSSVRNGRHWLSADCTTAEHKALYKVWVGIKKRCNNPKCEQWLNYGARGIKVCADWLEYQPFYNWAIGAGYRPGLSIDRIDPNGDYCPDNCRWANAKTQARNRRNTRYILVNGAQHLLQSLNERHSINHANVLRRLRLGWEPARAHAELTAAMGGVWGKDGVEITDNTINVEVKDA